MLDLSIDMEESGSKDLFEQRNLDQDLDVRSEFNYSSILKIYIDFKELNLNLS